MEVFIFIFILFLVISVVIGILKSNAEAASTKRNNEIVRTISDFSAVVSFGGVNYSSGVAIDPSREKFAIISINQESPKIFSFRDLVSVEVLKNEASITTTNRGSQLAGAAVGGALLGPAGLLLGGLSGSKSNQSLIKRLSLKIYTNDLIKPVYEICFFDASGTKGYNPDSFVLKRPLEELDEWYGRFQTILKMQAA